MAKNRNEQGHLKTLFWKVSVHNLQVFVFKSGSITIINIVIKWKRPTTITRKLEAIHWVLSPLAVLLSSTSRPRSKRHTVPRFRVNSPIINWPQDIYTNVHLSYYCFWVNVLWRWPTGPISMQGHLVGSVVHVRVQEKTVCVRIIPLLIMHTTSQHYILAGWWTNKTNEM